MKLRSDADEACASMLWQPHPSKPKSLNTGVAIKATRVRAFSLRRRERRVQPKWSRRLGVSFLAYRRCWNHRRASRVFTHRSPLFGSDTEACGSQAPPSWEISVVCIVDYFSHAWVCLVFAFRPTVMQSTNCERTSTASGVPYPFETTTLKSPSR